MAAPLALAGQPVNLTASGQVSAVPGTLLGVIINSANATGSFLARDGVDANGTAVMGALIPGNGVSGVFIPCYFEMNTGCYLTIAATINLTAIFRAAPLARATPTSPPQA